MPAEIKNEIALEIAHVLFIDIVAYSRMTTDDQRAAVAKLNQIVQATDEYRKEESEKRLLKIATGDGMALIFYHSPEDPVECALEISRALKEHPKLRVRMGVHSGPVSGVVDVNGRANVAGAGINMAQRVMDCGDAGHILLSGRVAEDLEQFKHWRPHLYHLGQCEVKHGEKIEIVNLFTAELGNSERPKKFTDASVGVAKRQSGSDFAAVQAPSKQGMAKWILVGVAIAALAVGTFLFWQRARPKMSAPAGDVAEKSIAVLPFDNLSRDPDNAFFADGVQDEVLTNLAKIADLKVISRTSVMQYKTGAQRNLREIAQQLGVAHVVEGSVQRAGNKVRVNAQLIEARTDSHLWAQIYDRDLSDVFAIQSDIAKSIADQLHARLSPSEKSAIEQRPTTDLIAFDQYSRAKTLLLSTDFIAAELKTFSQAIELLNNSVARDPSFHAAFCQLVYAHGQIYGTIGDRTPTRLAAAEAALQSASQLQPDSPETHLARGWHLYYTRRDYKGALAELEIARRGLTNDPRIVELTGYILRRQGKHEEGLRSLEQAIALDPRNFYTMLQLALSYQFLRRYAQEGGVLDRALEVAPDDVVVAALRGVTDLYWRANPERLDHFIERLRRERPASLGPAADAWFQLALAKRDWAAAEQALNASPAGLAWNDGIVSLNRNAGAGVVARARGDEAEARQAFNAARLEQEKTVEQQKDHGPALCSLALIDAALGNKELALQEGRRAMELMPVEKDATNGQRMIAYFALIAAWAGEKDLALEQLKTAIPLPGASTITSYGVLKLLPFWDPLRGDPRFEAIVASLAPKE